MADNSPTTSRRRALQSFGYFMGAGFTIAVAPTQARAAPLPLAPPTWHGRELLRLLAEYRAEWAKETLSDEDAAATSDITAEASAVAKEIVARPVQTMSDIVDRAIVVTWLTAGQGGSIDHWWDGDFAALAAPLAALGGVTVRQCSEDPDADAGAEA